MDGKRWLAVLLAVLVALPVLGGWAEEGQKPPEEKKHKKGPPEKGFMGRGLTMERLVERLGKDNALTDEQKPKVEAALAEVNKKRSELEAKEEVKAAIEQIKKAREAEDKDAMGAAFKKYREAMGGFDPMGELRKALTGVLTDAQLAKLGPPTPGKKDDLKKKGGEPKRDGAQDVERKRAQWEIVDAIEGTN